MEAHNMYEAQADDTIRVEDIAKIYKNRIIMDTKWPQFSRGQEGLLEYRPEGAHDMGLKTMMA